MTTRALVLAAALIAAGLSAAPTAHAGCTAGEVPDPATGVCWSSSATNLGITGTGGVCFPGRLGLCIAGFQNSQVPGAALRPQPPAGPAPRTSWP
ncbi:MAG: hypothetical protein ACKOB8_03135 [Mycobacterium sp.]